MDKAGVMEPRLSPVLHFAAGMFIPHQAALAQSLQDKTLSSFLGCRALKDPSFLPLLPSHSIVVMGLPLGPAPDPGLGTVGQQ